MGVMGYLISGFLRLWRIFTIMRHRKYCPKKNAILKCIKEIVVLRSAGKTLKHCRGTRCWS